MIVFSKDISPVLGYHHMTLVCSLASLGTIMTVTLLFYLNKYEGNDKLQPLRISKELI